MTRIVLLGIVLSGCAPGDGGAVSFRWRLVDQAGAGLVLDPADYAATDGSGACLCAPGDERCPGRSWIVHRVKLLVRDPITLGAPAEVTDADVTFPCRQREATTPFVVPPRDAPWALSLRAFDPDTPSAPDEGTTPAPDVRVVARASIVNLDIVEIIVRN